MLRSTFSRMMCLIFSGVFLLCLCTTATADDSIVDGKVIIVNGKNTLELEIKDKKVVSYTADAPTERFAKGGAATELAIAMSDGSTAQIIEVPDHTMIITDDPKGKNPGCTWYFIYGAWYMICD